MPISETQLKDLETQCLANKEAELSVTVPLSPRAFLRVESVVQAAALKSLEKRAVYGQRESLALTASREGLRIIGRDFNIDITPATKFKAVVEAVADPGSSVALGVELTSDDTGAYYKVVVAGSEAGGVVEFTIEASDAGEAANLIIGDTLSFTAPVSGVDATAEITAVSVTGEDEEEVEDFRRRVLNEQRKTSGGGNISDYRDWAESVSGVARAFPYSGKPITWQVESVSINFDAANKTIECTDPIFTDDDFGTVGIGDMIEVSGSASNDAFYTVRGVSAYALLVWEALTEEVAGADVTIFNSSQAGDRTVFVESVDNDGVPTESLLEAVRDGINYDDSGNQRPGLGDVDSCLYVEPIVRTTFDVEIFNLAIDATQEVAAKAQVVTALEDYFLALTPYLEGLDFEFDRNDIITLNALGKVVQNVLESYGASADSLIFTVDSEPYTSYQLGQGELAKLNSVEWSEVE